MKSGTTRRDQARVTDPHSPRESMQDNAFRSLDDMLATLSDSSCETRRGDAGYAVRASAVS